MVDLINAFLLRFIRGTPTRTQIACNESGFVISCDSKSTQASRAINWRDVTKIVALKRDCFSTDLICLLIATPATTFEVNERSVGWQRFIEEAQQNLPGMLAHEVWWP